jgi:hypothetical protein
MAYELLNWVGKYALSHSYRKRQVITLKCLILARFDTGIRLQIEIEIPIEDVRFMSSSY